MKQFWFIAITFLWTTCNLSVAHSAAEPEGIELFANKFCAVCHGNNGLGGIAPAVGPNIQGKDAAEIRLTLLEVVHSGITLTSTEVNDLAAYLALDPIPGSTPVIPATFTDPASCRICHPRQYREWQGNMMSYGAISPTFSALEFIGNSTLNGVFSRGTEAQFDAGTDLFCQRCHNPIDAKGDVFPTFIPGVDEPILRESATEVGRRGLSCDFCHQVKEADFTRMLVGDLGDGIANVALVVDPGLIKFGPLQDPQPNQVHNAVSDNNYLRSPEFCGACHDVRPRANDVLVPTEDFQRLEDLFTEWQTGPWNSTLNPTGGVVTCQDCHMDAGPPAPAGTYYDAETTVFPRPDLVLEQRVSTHYFTGVDIALVDFPAQDDPRKDEFGNSIGQLQRRNELLQSACTLEVSAPASIPSIATVLPVTVNVRNVGVGHNVPSGFSQERQMWVEFIVTDGLDQLIYRSGYLVDKAHPETGEDAPDGNLDDEDLEDLDVFLDPDTGEVVDPVTGLPVPVGHGPDYNQRPDGVNLGVFNFGNEFEHVSNPGTPEEEREEVFTPFLANHMNNGRSLEQLGMGRDLLYDVPLTPGVQGPIHITARLRYRPFPPRFLRLLATATEDVPVAGQPGPLVDEALVDRNLIVDMVTADPVDVLVDMEICEGDFDGDGDVDGSDLAVFAADFGRTDCGIPTTCDGDFDGDGNVDGSDLAKFAASFGRTDCPIVGP